MSRLPLRCVVAEVAERIASPSSKCATWQLLLHAALQAWQVQCPGLHKHKLHVARRLRGLRALPKRAWDRHKGMKRTTLLTREVECIGLLWARPSRSTTTSTKSASDQRRHPGSLSRQAPAYGGSRSCLGWSPIPTSSRSSRSASARGR